MRILIIVLLITAQFQACKKDEEADPVLHHGKINPNLYSMLFNVGSYWVYKDTITNNLDSIIVTAISKGSYNIPPSHPGQGSQGDEENFTISYLSYPTNTNYSEVLFASLISRGESSGGVIFISTKTVGDAILNANVESIIDTFIVEGHQYYNVTKMRILADSYISSDCNFYYADSIGIIKKETLSGMTITNTWNLLRYQTIIKPY